MATDPKSKGKKLNQEQEREKKRQALDEATKKKPQKASSKKQKAEATEKASKKGRRRVLPIWLRIILVVLFSAAALLIGLMVGYGVLGDGNPTDALDMDTWRHIWDIVMKTE